MSKINFLSGSEYPTVVTHLVSQAKKSIDIIFFDWRWYENKPYHPVQQLNLELIKASKRGVYIRAVLNAKDLIIKLNQLGIKAKTIGGGTVVHTKCIIIDNETLVIGSHNLTSNAFTRNLELSIVINIAEDVNRIETYFNNLYNIAHG